MPAKREGPTTREVLDTLSYDRGLTVREITATLALPGWKESVVSKRLYELMDCGLVTRTRGLRSKYTNYRVFRYRRKEG